MEFGLGVLELEPDAAANNDAVFLERVNRLMPYESPQGINYPSFAAIA